MSRRACSSAWRARVAGGVDVGLLWFGITELSWLCCGCTEKSGSLTLTARRVCPVIGGTPCQALGRESSAFRHPLVASLYPPCQLQPSGITFRFAVAALQRRLRQIEDTFRSGASDPPSAFFV